MVFFSLGRSGLVYPTGCRTGCGAESGKRKPGAMGNNVADTDGAAAAAAASETLSDQDDEISEEQQEDEPSDAASDIVEEEDESLHAASSASTSPQTIFEDEEHNSRKRRIEELDQVTGEEEEEHTEETEEKESTSPEPKVPDESGEDPTSSKPDNDNEGKEDETETDPEGPTSQIDIDGDVKMKDDEKGEKSWKAEDEEKEQPREDDESQEGEDTNETQMDIPPKVVDGISEFHVPTIRQHVVCGLCRGIYREPMTTIKCQHTFCKSCLTIALHSAWHTRLHNSCPTCHTYLGRSSELTSIAIPDRTLEALIDKVLFPEIAAADARAEANFYRQRGMARKELASTPAAASEAAKRFQNRRNHRSMPPRVVFQLLPANEDLSALHHPWLQVACTIRMRQLKKLVRNLLLGGGEGEDDGIEICCNDVPLGDELSVQFVQRSVWMGKADEPLQLTYRFSAVQEE